MGTTTRVEVDRDDLAIGRDGERSSVRRELGTRVGSEGQRKRLGAPHAIDPGQRLLPNRAALGREVSQGSSVGEGEEALPEARVLVDVVDDPSGSAGDLQALEVHGHGVKASLAAIDEMPGRGVAAVPSPVHQRAHVTRGAIQHRHARLAELVAADDGQQDSPPVRKDLREAMLDAVLGPPVDVKTSTSPPETVARRNPLRVE